MVMAVALNQSAFAGMLRFLGEPCMGVVNQIVDLDNSSQSQPIKKGSIHSGLPRKCPKGRVD